MSGAQRVLAIKKDEEKRRSEHREAMEQRVAELEKQRLAAAASGREEVRGKTPLRILLFLRCF